jgi:hypothetical protein
VDFGHAFPFPFLDWYYTAAQLRVGGLVVIDDTQLRPVAILKEFLISENGRWELVDDLGQTAVFRKTTTDLFSRVSDWPAQPFCADWKASLVRSRMHGRIKAIPLLGPLARLIYHGFKSRIM